MTEVLERDSAVPLYAQLEQILSGKITSGEWQPNQRIPSENELNRMYGLSRMTVRGVLTKLVNDGLLLRVPGKGTYVAPTKISAVSPAYRGIREQLEALGYSTTTRLVSFEREAATSVARDRLGLARGDEVYVIVRVRSVQGEPIKARYATTALAGSVISVSQSRASRRAAAWRVSRSGSSLTISSSARESGSSARASAYTSARARAAINIALSS